MSQEQNMYFFDRFVDTAVFLLQSMCTPRPCIAVSAGLVVNFVYKTPYVDVNVEVYSAKGLPIHQFKYTHRTSMYTFFSIARNRSERNRNMAHRSKLYDTYSRRQCNNHHLK